MPNLTELRIPETAQIMTQAGILRIRGTAGKPEIPARTDRIGEAEAVPGRTGDPERSPEEEEPAGSAGDTDEIRPQAAAPAEEPVNSPRDGAAFHPLRLRFP